MSERKMTLSLQDIQIPDLNPGGKKLFGKEDVLTATFSLVHPRFNTRVLDVTLPTTYTTAWKKNLTKHLFEGILFKEKVEGEFVLNVSIKIADKETDHAKFAKKFLKAIAGASLGVVTGGIGSPILGAIAKSGGGEILGLLLDPDSDGKDKGKVHTIGEGTKSFKSSELVSSIFKMNIGNREVTKMVLESRDSQAGRSKKKPVVAVSKENNKTLVTLSLEVFD